MIHISFNVNGDILMHFNLYIFLPFTHIASHYVMSVNRKAFNFTPCPNHTQCDK